MLKIMTFVAVSAVALATAIAPQPAQARNGQNAAAIAGGLAAGAIIGSQVGRDDDDRGYRRSRYRECHMERREFEDRYGNIRVRRVRVCD